MITILAALAALIFGMHLGYCIGYESGYLKGGEYGYDKGYCDALDTARKVDEA